MTITREFASIPLTYESSFPVAPGAVGKFGHLSKGPLHSEKSTQSAKLHILDISQPHATNCLPPHYL